MVAGMIIFIINGTDPDEMTKGETIAAIPIESIGSVMFEPIRVPTATPCDLFDAIRATVNSGSEVPSPDIVIPTTAGGTSMAIAISLAMVTN